MKKMKQGQKVVVSSRVSKIVNDLTNTDRLVLEDVYIDGDYFRGHIWVKNVKRLKYLSPGDLFSATAEIVMYPNHETNKLDKVGLKSFRNVQIMNENT